jgi:hypothetical protein
LLTITASGLGFNVRWVLLPTLYGTATLPVVVASMFVVGRIERALGCGWACEIGGLIALLVVGAPLFGSLSLWLARVERLRGPALIDHLRHCAALYAGLAVLGYALASSHDTERYGLHWADGAALFLAGAYAASVDAAVLPATQGQHGPFYAPVEGLHSVCVARVVLRDLAVEGLLALRPNQCAT